MSRFSTLSASKLMSTKIPRVSVVMASYNHESFVREAIESVLSQSYQDFEMVITDDCSADGTVNEIQSVPDSRIRMNVFTENRGACAAVNDALSRARGEYIAVLNSDDYFLPEKLDKQVAFLDANHGVGAVFGLPRFIDERGNLFSGKGHPFQSLFTDKNGSRVDWLRRFFHNGNCLCHPTVLIRKGCYEKVGTFDPLLMQLPDLDLWVRLCIHYDIHVLPAQLTAFRILDREKNTSAGTPARLARCAWELPSVLNRFLACSDEQLSAILDVSCDKASAGALRVALAMAAIRRDEPGYKLFGFELLRDCLKEQPDLLSSPEYFRLVGFHDPAAAEFYRYGHRFLKNNRWVAELRRLRRRFFA